MQVSFSQTKQILKKLPVERSADDIQLLKTYFKDNQFFQKYGEENGEKWLAQIYTAIKYDWIKQNNYVMRYGEFGSVYYIILKGKVQVRIPIKITEEFSFKELFRYVLLNFEFIIKNEDSSKMLDIIKFYFPECIEKTNKGKYNFKKEIADDILNGENPKKYLEKHGSIFPAFYEQNKFGEKVECK